MKKRIILGTCITMILCICLLNFSTMQAAAASPYKAVEKGTVTIDAGATAKIPFNISAKKHVMVVVWPESAGSSSKVTKGSFELKIKKSSGKTVGKYKASLKGWKLTDDNGGWINCYTAKSTSKGSYYVTLKNTTNLPIDAKYSIRVYSKVASKASIKKKRSVERGNWIKIGKIVGGLPEYKSIKSANNKIATNTSIDYDGNIYVYGRNAGTTTITTTLKNGKRFTTKITVKPQNLNVFACLYDYDTRDNYFTVRIKNNGSRSVTVIRSGGKVENYKYKDFDRSFKNLKAVTIKPGKTKYVRFYCKGSTTWDDYTQYTVFAKLKSEGKTYNWHVWDTNSAIKKGKSWYNSYWASYEYDYYSWNPHLDEDDYFDDDDYDYEDDEDDEDEYDYYDDYEY